MIATATTIALAIPAFIAIIVINCYRLSIRNAARVVKENPGLTCFYYYFPFQTWLLILDMIPDRWLPLRRSWWWHKPYEKYRELKQDALVISMPRFSYITIADADLIKQITMDRFAFQRPVELYRIISQWGQNVMNTEGDEWRRHKRIAAPSFAERHNQTVFHATKKLVHQMFSSWEALEQVTRMDDKSVLVNVGEATTRLALFVISSAGFGMDLPWTETGLKKEVLERGHRLSFRDALHEMLKYLPLRLFLPKWLYWIPLDGVREMRQALFEYDMYIDELIQKALACRRNNQEMPSNLLASLVQASESSEESKGKLSDSELKSNIFIFLFAGFETTANALSYSLSFLAVHQEIQQRAYEEIQIALKRGELTYKRVMNELPYVTAIMNESLRLFPPIESVPKIATQDVQLGPYFVPANTQVRLHVFALHQNPKYWGDDAERFRPERWFASPDHAKDAKATAQYMSDNELTSEDVLRYSREAFIPFSDGARGCLGKRFAQVEMMTTLSDIIRNYEIRLPEGVSQESLFKSTMRLTVRPASPPHLIFSKRDTTS